MPPSVYRPSGGTATAEMPACVAKQVDQTDQESRSAGRRAAPSVTAMDITIHSSFLPHTDPDASLAFYRDTLGFEVRNDVGYEGMRWITVGPADQPDTSIVLHPPAADPGITDEERRTILELMAKGTYAGVTLATEDLDGTFEQLEASGAEVVQEPTDQPYGVRDCAFRDPAGNLVRIQELQLSRDWPTPATDGPGRGHDGDAGDAGDRRVGRHRLGCGLAVPRAGLSRLGRRPRRDRRRCRRRVTARNLAASG